MIPHPAEREGGEQPPSSALPGTEKPIPAPQAGTGESLYSRQDQPGQPGTTSRGTEATRKPSPKALEPVVIRFRFDPAAKREINVARVHFGDSVSVKVRRFGQADLRLYLAFAVPNIVQTRAWQGWSAGTRREVTAPILDTDRISLTADGYFGTALTKELDSKEGAVLKLGADYPPGRGSLFDRPGRAAMKSRSESIRATVGISGREVLCNRKHDTILTGKPLGKSREMPYSLMSLYTLLT